MIGVCAGYFRPEFFFREMIILRESNSHARRQVFIPYMGIDLRASCKKDRLFAGQTSGWSGYSATLSDTLRSFPPSNPALSET